MLAAIGASPAATRGAVRFSLGHGTTGDEIERALEMIGAAAARMGRVTPAGAASGRPP